VKRKKKLRNNRKIKFILGDKKNFKITTKDDLNYLKSETYFGIGFDVHRLIKNKKLFLGGVKIPFHSGLKGHSDGDVILHSIIDGLLGAMRKSDIGTLFPSNLNRFKNIRSKNMLEPVLKFLKNNNFSINNIDINLICEKPKVSKYREKIIASLSNLLSINKDQINLKGKTVAVEEGVVDDFLLVLALNDVGVTRDDVIIKGLPTDQAATAFAAGKVDAVGAFPPFTGTAMKRPGARVIASSKEYPGAIPDLLAVSGDLISERPDDDQKIVKTWWDVREFMEKNPRKSEKIMAKRAGIPTREYKQYKGGTRFFSLKENLEAFSDGFGMKHMPYAAKQMADFMVKVGFIPEKPDMSKLFDSSFVKNIS